MDFYDLPKGKALLVSQKALIKKQSRLLILKNTTDNPQWELPGGLLEMGEDMESGLKREVKEETGIEISVEKLVVTWDYWLESFRFKDNKVLDVRVIGLAYFCSKTGGKIKLSHEHSQYKWATKKELLNLNLAPNSKIAINAHINNKF